MEGDVADGARLPPAWARTPLQRPAPPPSGPAPLSSHFVMGTNWGPEPRDWAEEALCHWEMVFARLCSLGSSICGAGARLPAPRREVTSGLQEAQVWGRWDPAGHLPAQEDPPHLSGGAGTGGQPQIPQLGGGGLHWFCLFCGSGETVPGDHASLTDDQLCGQRGRACRQVCGPLKGMVSAGS